MSNNPFPLQPNELIEFRFGIKFFCIDSAIIEIHVLDNESYIKIKTSQKLAEVFYYTLDLLYMINPNLICQYGTVNNCISFSKRKYNLDNVLYQHDAFWVFFQVTGMKIQLSMTIQKKFQDFYQKNNIKFDDLMNTNEQLIQDILKGKNNTDRRHINKITRYKSKVVHDWLNFNLVDCAPLSLLFELFKQVDLIKP